MFLTNNPNPRSGDTSAFDQIYALFAPRVLAYLLRLNGGSRAEAEDLTQDTFLAAYAARSGYAGNNPLAWLFGIARRRQRDAFRASTTRPRTAPMEQAESVIAGTALDETATSRIALTNALDRLEAIDREAVLLVVVQGMSYVDAAKITGEPVGTVKWRVYTATKRLRNLLSGAFAEEYPMETRKETDSRAEPKQTALI